MLRRLTPFRQLPEIDVYGDSVAYVDVQFRARIDTDDAHA